MYALLFNLMTDWVMQQTTLDRPRVIRWTLFSTLEDLDDLALVSHTHQHMQEKTICLSVFAKQVGLKISRWRQVMMLNVPNPLPVKVNRDLPTKEFTYLGSTVRHDGRAGSDIRNHLNKARNAFRMLNNMTLWKTFQYSTKTKLSLYQSCILSILLYSSQYWRMTESNLNKLSTFHTKNLSRLLRIVWPKTIPNQHLTHCNQDSMGTIIMRERWG